jgi:hypothetical protein
MTRDTDMTATATLPPKWGTLEKMLESAFQKVAKNVLICKRKDAEYPLAPKEPPKKLKLMLPVEAIESPTTEVSWGAEKETNVCLIEGLAFDTTKPTLEPLPAGPLTKMADVEIQRETSKLVKTLIEKELSWIPKFEKVNKICWEPVQIKEGTNKTKGWS